MANIRFYMKADKGNGRGLIMMSLTYYGRRCRISTGMSALHKDWSVKEQRVISGGFMSEHINTYLNAQRLHLWATYLRLSSGLRIPTPETIRSEFKKERNGTDTDHN